MSVGAEGEVDSVVVVVEAEEDFPEVAVSHREAVHLDGLAGEAGGAVHRSEAEGEPDTTPLLITKLVMDVSDNWLLYVDGKLNAAERCAVTTFTLLFIFTPLKSPYLT